MRNPEHVLRATTRFDKPIEEVFAFFAAAENLETITPPELAFRIETKLPIDLKQGTLIDYTLGLFGVRFRWKTEITTWDPPYEFIDTQLRGPYAQWIHLHSFRRDGSGTVMEDEVRYRLPVPILGMVAYPVVRLQVQRIFAYREKRIRALL